jgi:hypothetical protein
MDVASIEFVFEDEDETVGELCCPSCGAVWAFTGDGEGEVVNRTECPHLRFIFVECADHFGFPGAYTEVQLLADVEPALRAMSDDLDEEASVLDWITQEAFDDEMWERVVSREVDTVFFSRQEGIACGPASHTVIFGAQMRLTQPTPESIRER